MFVSALHKTRVAVRATTSLKLLAVLAVAWAVPAVLFGGVPVIPWHFLAALFVFALPMAFALTLVASVLDRVASPGTLLPISSIATGALFLALMKMQDPTTVALALAFMAAFAYHISRPQGRRIFATLGVTTIILALGFGALQNVNYIAAYTTIGRTHDGTLRDIDLAIYRWLYTRDVEYVDLFPLFRSPTVFRLFENAYSALFIELITVVLAFAATRDYVVRVLSGIFMCYFVGIVVFLIYPTLGPCILYPESFSSDYRLTLTGAVMTSLATEYRAAVQGTSANGFGYFIALPSLHIAIATLCQLVFSSRAALFWLFMPINIMLTLSTIVLGYHYIVDVPAGIALGAIIYVSWLRRWTAVSTAQRSSYAARDVRQASRQLGIQGPVD